MSLSSKKPVTFAELEQGDIVVLHIQKRGSSNLPYSWLNQPLYISSKTSGSTSSSSMLIENSQLEQHYAYEYRNLPEDNDIFIRATKAQCAELLAQRAEPLTDPRKAINSNGNIGYVGTDPEFFVLDAKNVVVPAWSFLGPKSPKLDAKDAQHYYDGFQAELSVPPSTCHQVLSKYVRQGMHSVLKAAPGGSQLTWKSVIEVPSELMNRATDEQAGLGCLPSLSVYPDEQPLSVLDPRSLRFRFAGCHMHQGIGKQTKEQYALVVRLLDAILGPVMVSLLDGLEDSRRRQFYGRAGEYRLPPHGLEYRTPSSAVLCHPVVFHLCFDIARLVTYMALRGREKLWVVDQERARSAVNSLDVQEARSILESNKIVLDRMLTVLYGSYSKNAWRLIQQGVQQLMDVSDMTKSWNLTGLYEADGYIGRTVNSQVSTAVLSEQAIKSTASKQGNAEEGRPSLVVAS